MRHISTGFLLWYGLGTSFFFGDSCIVTIITTISPSFQNRCCVPFSSQILHFKDTPNEGF